jgi:hypothetical protein
MIYTTDFYNYGYATSGAFCVLAMALLVVGIMQRKKELAYKQSLALIRSGCEETSVYSIGQVPRTSYIYRTASSGLSLGCELFIVFPGLFKAAPGLAVVIIILRLLHMVVALLLVGATFTRGTYSVILLFFLLFLVCDVSTLLSMYCSLLAFSDST